MASQQGYRLTGSVVLIVGILFFLRDNGLNLIGETSGWSIFIILIGAAILSTNPKSVIKNMYSKVSKKK